jgi:hypothetical protein
MIKRSGLPRGCTYEAELLIEWPNCAESITHLCPYSSPAQRKPDWQRWVVNRRSQTGLYRAFHHRE